MNDNYHEIFEFYRASNLFLAGVGQLSFFWITEHMEVRILHQYVY